jgi:hypothetical protein
MGEMEDKLTSMLNDPQMMQKVMAMAQSLTGDSPGREELPGLDLGMVQKLSGLASRTGIDKDQRSLLQALKPYLSRERIDKLEKAMRAAKMARMASGFLAQQSPSSQ